ncbi:MAG TPA: ROK family protein, partial [Ilumatobacteraceae bacterium]|nr:ROK family protein [Ilumatobacteraceae bacterium]
MGLPTQAVAFPGDVPGEVPGDASVAAIGVDIGATSTRVAAFDGSDGLLARRAIATPRGPAAIVEAVTGLVREVLGRPAADGNRLDGGVAVVAVGVPGRVDIADGSVRYALNLGIDAPTPFGADLASRIGCAVHVENDVNAGAVGAAALLGVTPPSSLAYLSIGTGLAAGLVLDGRIHRGSTGMAGEVGHVPIRSDGPLCSCGQRGCAETLGSGRAIAERWGPHGAAALWEAADAGDQVAAGVRDDLVGAICATIRHVVLTLDVDIVALGGGVGELGDPLVRELRRWLAAKAEHSPLLATLRLGDRLRLVPAGCPVGELGAVLAARRAGAQTVA